MGSEWVLATYLFSSCVAVALLWLLGRRAWYWHAIAALSGMVIGLVPPPGASAGTGFYVVTGSLFLFLFSWGVGAAVFAALSHVRRPLAEMPRVKTAGGAQKI